MNKSIFVTSLITAAVLPAACTWVKPTSGGNAVRVAYDGNVAGCRDAGAVSVSVTSDVGFYHRPGLKVRDELETLARNEAASLPADTIKPLDEPSDGQQHFQAYVCGNVRMQQRDAAMPNPKSNSNSNQDQGDVQTYPVNPH